MMKLIIRRTFIVLTSMTAMTYLGVVNSPDYYKNPDNEEFLVELAFNLEVPISEVTQADFYARYLSSDTK